VTNKDYLNESAASLTKACLPLTSYMRNISYRDMLKHIILNAKINSSVSRMEV